MLTGDFDYLITLNESLLPLLSQGDKNWINKTFNYDKKGSVAYQRKISNFFINKRYDLNLNTCYFCNIDYVNAFKDTQDYHHSLDFVKRASIVDLLKIEGVTEIRARKIIEQRPTITNISDLNIPENVKDNLDKVALKKSHSHFTLDHVLDKKKYPLFSLSRT